MIRNLRHVLNTITELNVHRINQIQRSCLLSNRRAAINLGSVRTKKDDSNKSALFKPVPIRPTEDDINVGEEITGGSLDKAELLKILNKFSQKREVRMLCFEHGLDRKSQINYTISPKRIFVYFRTFAAASVCQLSSLLP